MHIAFLTPTLPWPANTGGSLRTYHLLRELAQRHTVDLICFYYGTAPTTLGPLATCCHTVTALPLGAAYTRRRQVRDLLRVQPQSVSYFTDVDAQRHVATLLAAPYDLLICDEVMVAPYALVQSPSSSPPRLLIRPKIDHQHYRDLAAGRPWGLKKLLDWLEAQRLQRYERLILPAFQQAVVCSAEDAASTAAQCPTIAIEIIPNGADTEYFQPAEQAADRPMTGDPAVRGPTILLLGTMHYYPNIDAVRYFFDTMYNALRGRYPKLEVLIVGHQPPAAVTALATLPGVTVTGSVAEIRPYLARSSLLAVPLRLGGGTRLKITEAMAAGLPVVSTPIGAQGLAVENEHHLLLAAEPAAFIAAIQRLLDDPSLGQRLAEAGRKLVESQYSWQTLGQRFTALCAAMVAAQRRNDHPTKRPSDHLTKRPLNQ